MPRFNMWCFILFKQKQIHLNNYIYNYLMNVINNFLNFYNDRKELMVIQKANDEKMGKLTCKDVLVTFLLFERNKTRDQIDNASEHGLWSIDNYFTNVNELNKSNLNYLSNLLKSENEYDICKKCIILNSTNVKKEAMTIFIIKNDQLRFL